MLCQENKIEVFIHEITLILSFVLSGLQIDHETVRDKKDMNKIFFDKAVILETDGSLTVIGTSNKTDLETLRTVGNLDQTSKDDGI